MFCKKCGKKLEDGVKFCTYCGCPAPSQVQISGNIPPDEKEICGNDDVQEHENKKSGGLNILIVLLAVLLAVCLAAAGILIFKPNVIKSVFDKKNQHTDEEVIASSENDTDAVSGDSSSEASTETYADAAPTGPAENETVSVSEMPGETKVPGDSEDDAAGIHSYYIVAGDIDFQEAFDDAAKKGKDSYLAHINSQEEMDCITQMIENSEYKNYIFWLGGISDDNGEYHWIDTAYRPSSEVLDTSQFWMDGEPSRGYTDAATGDYVEENCITMFYQKSSGRYVFNDTPSDISAQYPGKIAYIVEADGQ